MELAADSNPQPPVSKVPALVTGRAPRPLVGRNGAEKAPEFGPREDRARRCPRLSVLLIVEGKRQAGPRLRDSSEPTAALGVPVFRPSALYRSDHGVLSQRGRLLVAAPSALGQPEQ